MPRLTSTRAIPTLLLVPLLATTSATTAGAQILRAIMRGVRTESKVAAAVGIGSKVTKLAPAIHAGEEITATAAKLAAVEQIAGSVLHVSEGLFHGTVSRVPEATVLVGVHDGEIVALSNVLHDGDRATAHIYPREEFSLPNVISHMEYEPPSVSDQINNVSRRLKQRAAEDSTHFILKQELFADSSAFDLDLGEAQNIDILTSDGTLLPLRELVINGESFRVAKLGNTFYASPADTTASARITELRARRFGKDEYRILSLLNDAGADSLIDELMPGMRLVPSAMNETAVRAAMQEAKGRRVLMLGYLHDDEIASVDEKGQERFSLALTSGSPPANQADVMTRAVPVGLNPSEIVIQQRKRFGHLDAIRRLARALDANSVGSFYERLAAQDVRLFVPQQGAADASVPLAVIGIVGDSSRYVNAALLGSIPMLLASSSDLGFWARHPYFKWACIVVGGLFVLGLFSPDDKKSTTARTT